MPEEQKNPLGFGCQVTSCQNKRKKGQMAKKKGVWRGVTNHSQYSQCQKKSPGLCFQWRLLNGKKFKTKIPDSKPRRIWVQELLNIEEEKMNILTFFVETVEGEGMVWEDARKKRKKMLWWRVGVGLTNRGHQQLDKTGRLQTCLCPTLPGS